jgi:hypothetical protein
MAFCELRYLTLLKLGSGLALPIAIDVRVVAVVE